jgi:uncharacterized protein
MNANLLRILIASALFTMLVPSMIAQNALNHPRIISVTGNASIEVAPDEVIVTLGLDSRDKDLAIAKNDNDKQIKQLINITRAAGIPPANVQTSALTMGPEYSEDKNPQLIDYRVSQTVVVTMTDLSKYESLMTSILNVGVKRVDGVYFTVADPSKLRAEARLKALQAAQDKAAAMAKQLGQKIGKPWEIIEGSDVDAFAPRTNAIYSRVPVQEENISVAGGQVPIRAVVLVSFELE